MSKDIKLLTSNAEKEINRNEINQLTAFFDVLIKIDQRVKREKKYENIRNTNNSN